jgi:hypothetical protein
MASSIAAGLKPGTSLADVTELGAESRFGVLNAERESGVVEADMLLAVFCLCLRKDVEWQLPWQSSSSCCLNAELLL